MPTPRQTEALRLVAEGRFVPSLVWEADGGWYARWRATGADDNPWVDEAVRRATMTPLSADAEAQRHETLHDAWLMALRSRTGRVVWDDAACAAFAAELAAWARPATEADPSARAALVFRFEEGAAGFAVSCAPPRGLAQHRALGEAPACFGPLRTLHATGRGDLRADLSRSEAETFLRTGAKRLREAGYGVAGCEVEAPVTAEADLLPDADAPQGTPYRAKLTVRVAGEAVSAEEIRFLLEQGSTLVFFRDRWIEVDRSLLREALRALEKADGRRLTRMESVAFAQGLGAAGRLAVAEARAHGGLRGLLNELRASGQSPLGAAERLPATFTGALRAYQARGVAWMAFLTGHGFGALLADDMGLGKTVQTLAWLCLVAVRPCLIVAPLSLIANWRHELAAFAPSLRVYVHHGERRHLASGCRRAAMEADVTLTSYTLLVKDYGDLSEVPWEAVVLDEAQTVKNPDTRFARAVRALNAPRRVALTGTPVENSVSDLWSLEAFLNPGLLPDRTAFRDDYVRPLAADPLAPAGKRLRHALEPFMLRRLKSDGGIAAEIGEKREVREYCELTARERAAYEAALDEWRTGPREQGDAFALITHLKLVCDGMATGEMEEGGKLARLTDLLDALFAAGESALVFTQYAKVGAALRDALAQRFGTRPPFLHGGLTARAREAEIAAFNAPGPRAFILSLKAGGVGLNLTKATHVIHYDRWWNPAVEAQATDRAHRIGQTAVVFVHLFIAAGTLEERVDAILERKLAAAGSLVTSGEGFLAAMGAEEFARTVALAPADGSADGSEEGAA